jgi:hypothetical protein
LSDNATVRILSLKFINFLNKNNVNMSRLKTILFLQIRLKAATCFGWLGNHLQAEYKENKKGACLTVTISDFRSQIYNTIFT